MTQKAYLTDKSSNFFPLLLMLNQLDHLTSLILTSKPIVIKSWDLLHFSIQFPTATLYPLSPTDLQHQILQPHKLFSILLFQLINFIPRVSYIEQKKCQICLMKIKTMKPTETMSSNNLAKIFLEFLGHQMSILISQHIHICLYFLPHSTLDI